MLNRREKTEGTGRCIIRLIRHKYSFGSQVMMLEARPVGRVSDVLLLSPGVAGVEGYALRAETIVLWRS